MGIVHASVCLSVRKFSSRGPSRGLRRKEGLKKVERELRARPCRGSFKLKMEGSLMCLVLNTECWDLRVSPAGREGGESY